METFEIDSDAKLIETKEKHVKLDSTKVLVFVDHDEKVVYLWRGKNAGLFKRLMGTRVAAKLSHNYPDYRIRPVGQGHEPIAFLQLLGLKK
ncbi:MAG: hypothetical protein GF411_16630 [Candidatus Lokiarchaeota archaeon]|nr:hypothetical protein [Candidatus Lokiarchaeota archaeon]